MSDDLRARNFTAIALLVVGKIAGIAGLAVGARSRILGGTLLALDAVCITAAIVLAFLTMRARSKMDDAQKEVVRQMLREGTLHDVLRDLEAEQAKVPDDAR